MQIFCLFASTNAAKQDSNHIIVPSSYPGNCFPADLSKFEEVEKILQSKFDLMQKICGIKSVDF
jgi:hypothetical protein